MKVKIKLQELTIPQNFIKRYYDIEARGIMNEPIKESQDDFDSLLKPVQTNLIDLKTKNHKDPCFDFKNWANTHKNSTLIMEFSQDRLTYEGDGYDTVTIIIKDGKVFRSPCEMKYLDIDELLR